MRIYYVNNNHSVSMSIFASRLWQHLRMIHPSWSCGSLSPLKERIATQPNKYLRNLSDFIAYPLFLKWGLRHVRFDLFHITDHSYAYLIDSLDRERTVVTCHDLMMYKLQSGELGFGPDRVGIKPATLERNIGRVKKIGLAGRIIADSESTKQDMGKYLGIESGKIEVIYPGLNHDFRPITESAKKVIRADHGLKDERLILCVGNNQFYKNLEGVIEALSMIIDYLRRNNVVLIKAGSDFSEPQKKMIERYGLQAHIRYMGYVISPENINDLYNITELILFPSFYEGFGWPPIEAMACGTPVIASEAGSLKEVLNGAAYTVDPADYQQISQAVIRVLEDRPLRDSLINKGIANAARFDWQCAAGEHARLYAKIVDG